VSDFLVRLARRAAGVAPTAIPRPPDLPAELLVPVADREDAIGERTAEWPATADAEGVEPAAPGAPTPAEPAPPFSPPVRVEAALPQTTLRPARETEAPAPVTREGPPSEVPPLVATVPRPPEPVAVLAREEARREESAEPAVFAEPQARGAEPETRVLPAPRPVDVMPARTEADREDEGDDPLVVVVAPVPPTGEPDARRSDFAEAPLPMVSAGPAPAPVAWPAEGREADPEPSIQVHIGRIELVPPPPPPPSIPAAPRRVPRGFGEMGMARRHLDRRWY
jgi:hypothetical protein